jgi:hypothetical protein
MVRVPVPVPVLEFSFKNPDSSVGQDNNCLALQLFYDLISATLFFVYVLLGLPIDYLLTECSAVTAKEKKIPISCLVINGRLPVSYGNGSIGNKAVVTKVK